MSAPAIRYPPATAPERLTPEQIKRNAYFAELQRRVDVTAIKQCAALHGSVRLHWLDGTMNHALPYWLIGPSALAHGKLQWEARGGDVSRHEYEDGIMSPSDAVDRFRRIMDAAFKLPEEDRMHPFVQQMLREELKHASECEAIIDARVAEYHDAVENLEWVRWLEGGIWEEVDACLEGVPWLGALVGSYLSAATPTRGS